MASLTSLGSSSLWVCVRSPLSPRMALAGLCGRWIPRSVFTICRLCSPSSDWLGRLGRLASLCGHSWWVLGLGSWKQNQELELCALIMVCGLALSTEQSQRDAEIIFFLFSFFPSFVSSLLLALSHPPSFLLSLSVDAGCYQHSEKSFVKMTSFKTLSPKSLSGPGRGHRVRGVPPSLLGHGSGHPALGRRGQPGPPGL